MIFGKHINKYYLKYFPMLFFGLVALVAVDYFQLKVPEFYKLVINGMNGNIPAFDLDFLLDNICLPLIGVILVMVAGRFLWRICFFGAGIRVETDIRNEMFDHCKDLSREYYQVNKVGNLMSLFTNDLETVQDCFGSGILMFFDAAVLGGLAVFKMFRMNPVLTGFCMIPMVFLFIVGLIVGKAEMDKWEKRQEAFSEISDFSQESFSGIAVIKAFVKETKELLAFRWLNKKNEEANIDFTRTSTLLNIFVTLFVESVVCVILGYGGFLVYKGEFDAGELVEFIGYFTAIVWPVMAVSQLIEMASRGKASLGRISDLLDAKQDVVDAEGVMELTNPKGKIEFRNLTFRYPDGENTVLENASFVIEAGESVGIVGKTGSGKTTIVDLMLRMYNVDKGMLFVDDKDVNDLSIRSVRAAMAYVPQDNFLFSDTIENNIAFGGAHTDSESVVRAAKYSDVHTDISEFRDGYRTVLGERGVTVSGGQKQRISIARALLKEASVLILDDSVSAVDTKTERSILSALKETGEGRTTILIAHRISTVEQMDKIVFVEDGTVRAVGKHTELYETCEEYRKMVDLQKLEDEGEGQANA